MYRTLVKVSCFKCAYMNKSYLLTNCLISKVNQTKRNLDNKAKFRFFSRTEILPGMFSKSKSVIIDVGLEISH